MGPSYELLREQYVNELRAVKGLVNDWWSTLVADTVAKSETLQEAEKTLRRRWPVGASAHPRILGVVRKYFLACEELNQKVRASQASSPTPVVSFSLANDVSTHTEPEEDLPLSPGVLVGESLFTASSEDLAKIVGRLSYWPVGLDEHGRFV